jgi:hypothetical protein
MTEQPDQHGPPVPPGPRDLVGEAAGTTEMTPTPIIGYQGVQVDPRDVNTCRSCGASIWWRVNPSGARQPFDYSPRHRMGTLMPHHATCPQGREWQRRRQS